MGVTLERVQNKFACIIGELCSEPYILSQFAVWVDLRIAEYKTNGTISLDCSGMPPNPGWMKGVKNSRLSTNTVDTGQGVHRRRSSFTNSPNIQMSPSASPLSSQMFNDRLQGDSSRIPHNSGTQQPNFQSRLSPDIVLIKDEPGSEQPSSCALSRKRTSDSGDMQSDFYSPMKSRRLGGPSSLSSTAQESSSNQSLMSIINTENDSVVLEQADESDIFKATMDMQEELHKSSQGLSASPSNSAFSPRRPTATATSSSSSPVQHTWPVSGAADPIQGSSSQTASHWTSPTRDVVRNSEDLQRGSDWRCGSSAASHSVFAGGANDLSIYNSRYYRKERILNIHEKPAATVHHMLAAVNTFERWVSESAYGDQRKVEEIPPGQLSSYLTEFFRCVKKMDGEEYNPVSLATLRSSLDRYLRDYNYPYSIVKSPEFGACQMAYRERLQKLKSTAQQNRENLDMLPRGQKQL